MCSPCQTARTRHALNHLLSRRYRPLCLQYAYEGFCKPTPAITTVSERTDHWTRTRPSRARFSGSDASRRTRCSADWTTSIAESSVQVLAVRDAVPVGMIYLYKAAVRDVALFVLPAALPQLRG